MMYGNWSVMGGLFMLVFWVFVIALAVWLVQALGRSHTRDGGATSALRILEERLARGEIDPEEFRVRRAAIADSQR